MANTSLPVPPTPRQADSDLYHGIAVADPYRWLEDGDAPLTQQWVASQNERTRQALDARRDSLHIHGGADRDVWHERLVALMSLPVVMHAKVRGDRLFVVERSAGAEQFSLVLRSASDATAEPQMLVDPGSVSADSTTALDWFYPSPDGRLVAYGLSEGGTENSTLAILDIETGDHLADSIPDTRAATVSWLPDASGFYYAGYPHGDQYNRRILFHTLGTDVDDDPIVWADSDAPQSWPDVQLSADGRYLLVEVLVGWGQNDAFVLDRTDGSWMTVIADVEATSGFDMFGDDQLLITSTFEAPKGRVSLAPLSAPWRDNWTTVVPECNGVIGRAQAFGDEVLIVVTERAVDRIERWPVVVADGVGATDTQPVVTDLGVVSVAGVAVDGATHTAFVTVAGFDSPATLFKYDAIAGPFRWTPAEAALVASLQVTQVTYPSLDGTPIGLFLIHRADVEPNPDTPTILNGYGGFAISETPLWSPTIAAWCAQGGMYAIAGLRGGLEEGEAWHHAGRRGNKQNVFDDFHAAADWLVATDRTSRAKLAIAGGSNGGLLVGVALTQRPGLCAAVWCAVPLLDMIRFPQFLIARLWTDEYGDPDVEEEFGWLWSYSPYHHVRSGESYPAVLLTTAEGDTRVDPLHARKMAAEMQWASAGQDQRPILLLQEGRAGHGVGKPASKRASEAADVLTFFQWQLQTADQG
ncbi:MAG: prolyl oligopeptidase family serine peptidase [Ilumatobacteraceae bacterium]